MVKISTFKPCLHLSPEPQKMRKLPKMPQIHPQTSKRVKIPTLKPGLHLPPTLHAPICHHFSFSMIYASMSLLPPSSRVTSSQTRGSTLHCCEGERKRKVVVGGAFLRRFSGTDEVGRCWFWCWRCWIWRWRTPWEEDSECGSKKDEARRKEGKERKAERKKGVSFTLLLFFSCMLHFFLDSVYRFLYPSLKRCINYCLHVLG